MSAVEKLAALPPDARAAALAVLDELTTLLEKKDLDRALAPLFTRTQRIRMIAAIQHSFTIVALFER